MVAIIGMLVLAVIIGGTAIVLIQRSRDLRLGDTVKLETHRVKVREITYDPAHGYLVWAKVCVVNPLGNAPTNPLTLRAWRVEDQNGRGFRPSLVDDAVQPRGMYPRDARYAVGECASGVVPFAGLPAGSKITAVIYQGSTSSATWRV